MSWLFDIKMLFACWKLTFMKVKGVKWHETDHDDCHISVHGNTKLFPLLSLQTEEVYGQTIGI